MPEYSGSDAFIDVFNRYGVEHMFFNPGIDNVPIIEALSKYRATGNKTPRGILCLHEYVAMTAAHGNYMATGKPQAVFVHSELGTQQIGGALHNVHWGRVPVVFCAEPLGTSKRTNWKQESFDQGAMVRNCVKWDHQLQDNEDIHEILHKAFEIATTDPCGPVYLVLPRDIYGREFEKPINPGKIDMGSKSLPAVDESKLNSIIDILLNAKDPLIITGYSGRNPTTVRAMTELAETISARVLPANMYMNFPSTHPLTACIDPDDVSRRKNHYLTSADVILAIDYDMPYAAPPTVPAPDAKIVHIDMDLKKTGEFLWKREPDLMIEADSGQVIPILVRLLNERIDPEVREIINKRFDRLRKENEVINTRWRERALSHANVKPITADWLCHCINEVITEDTILVNQTISPASIAAHQIQRTIPGTLLSCPGGAIGWALGAGLGTKLAYPEKTVISLMGDGAFIYGSPVAALWSAASYRAPFLSIIFNNRAYKAIKGLFRNTYDVENMGADISNPPDYASVAKSCHAFGKAVDDPSDVMPALREALEEVEKGKSAVIDVRL